MSGRVTADERIGGEAELVTMRVAGELHDALRAEDLRSLDSGVLEQFLAGRRWFGGKGRELRAVQITRVIPFRWPRGEAAIAELLVEYREGSAERYQLPLTVRAAQAADQLPRAILARVEGPRSSGYLTDAVENESFREALASAFAGGATFAIQDARWVVEPVATNMTLSVESRVSGAEQSNTSIIFGQDAILKLFRRLEHGIHPDLEIARFLTTRAGFRGTPELLGAIRLEEAGGTSSAAGMLQRYVTGSTDAWSYALARGRDDLGAPDDTATTGFAHDAERLGRLTKEMHEALASDEHDPDFAPIAAGADDAVRWAEQTGRSVERAIDLIGDHVGTGELPTADEVDAKRLAEMRPRVDASIRLIAHAGAGMGARIRHHGDYHLGQVLRSPAGEYLVIDFEGEPSRPLDERRQRNSALRDVAGMLRSFSYAAATLSAQLGGHEAAALPDESSAAVQARAERWEAAVRGAFLRGYFGVDNVALPSWLPATRSSADALIALFETEKVFYELAYELNNRPDWVWIPLRGALRMAGT